MADRSNFFLFKNNASSLLTSVASLGNSGIFRDGEGLGLDFGLFSGLSEKY